MKILIFGPSGAGKTYVSHALANKGINAFDADEIDGLSAWYNKNGHKVPAPSTAREALTNQYSFVWDRRFLKEFLNKFTTVYIFGGSGNTFSVLDLFDRVFFLHVDPLLQQERLKHSSRPNPLMDKDEDGTVIWGEWLAKEAEKHGITFINAALSPDEIFSLLNQNDIGG